MTGAAGGAGRHRGDARWRGSRDRGYRRAAHQDHLESPPTAWLALDELSAVRLKRIVKARARARRCCGPSGRRRSPPPVPVDLAVGGDGDRDRLRASPLSRPASTCGTEPVTDRPRPRRATRCITPVGTPVLAVSGSGRAVSPLRVAPVSELQANERGADIFAPPHS